MPERNDSTNNEGLRDYSIHTAVDVIVAVQHQKPLINHDELVVTELIRIADEIIKKCRPRHGFADWMNI